LDFYKTGVWFGTEQPHGLGSVGFI